MSNDVVPELDVSDLSVSLRFFENVLGFAIVFAREEERFAYLRREGAELMLQEANGPGRRFRTASLEKPYGRGVNFQIKVSDVGALYDRVCGAGFDALIPLEDRWYPPRHDFRRQSSVRRGRSRWIFASALPGLGTTLR